MLGFLMAKKHDFLIGKISSNQFYDSKDEFSRYDPFVSKENDDGQENFVKAIEKLAGIDRIYAFLLRKAYDEGFILKPKIMDNISGKIIGVETEGCLAVVSQKDMEKYEDPHKDNPKLEGGENNYFLFRRIFKSRAEAFKFAKVNGVYRTMNLNEENLESLKRFMISSVSHVLDKSIDLD